MSELPYEPVLAFVADVHAELIPTALQEAFDRRRRTGVLRTSDPERMLRRVRGVRTHAEFVAWLHGRATLAQWATVDSALWSLMRTLMSPQKHDRAAMQAMVVELLANPTPTNVVRLALRGPVDPTA